MSAETPEMFPNTPSEWAVFYAEHLGWAVFPLRPWSKQPFAKDHKCSAATHQHGFHDATNDVATVRAWWTEHPTANIGIATGAFSGIDIVDVDVKDGKQGDKTLEKLEREHGVLPATMRQRTRSGGLQYIFRHTPGVGRRISVANGLDLLGDNGYTIVPPSAVQNNRCVYSWNEPPSLDQLAPLPSWVVGLTKPSSTSRKNLPGWEAAVIEGVEKGSRDETAIKLIGQWFTRGDSKREVLDLALAWAARCTPPLECAIVESMVERIAQKEEARWGELPEGVEVSVQAEQKAAPAQTGKGRQADPTAVMISADQNEDGNAARFVALYGDRLRYDMPRRVWLVWDGTRWHQDARGVPQALAKKTVKKLQRLALQRGLTGKDSLLEWGLKSGRRVMYDNMLVIAQSDLAVTPEELDADPWVLNVQNGTLDLRTGQLRPHRADDLHTKLAPVAFNPAATCPQWEAFLDLVLDGNQGLKTYLQRIVGYFLTGDISEQKVFVLNGDGGNGKSQFVATITGLLGDYAKPAKVNTFLRGRMESGGDHRDDLAQFPGARLVTAGEPRRGAELDEPLINQLTGGETIPVRAAFGKTFPLKPLFKILFSVNNLPEIPEGGESTWRRVKPVPFRVRIADRASRVIRDYYKVLLGEAPGILNWALRGCLDWQREGLAEPEEIRAEVEAYRRDTGDGFERWLVEETELEPGAATLTRDLYESYRVWAKREEISIPLSPRGLGKKLGNRGNGIVAFRTEKLKGWRGIRLSGLPFRSGVGEFSMKGMVIEQLPETASKRQQTAANGSETPREGVGRWPSDREQEWEQSRLEAQTDTEQAEMGALLARPYSPEQAAQDQQTAREVGDWETLAALLEPLGSRS